MAKASYVWSGSEWLPIASAFPTAHQRGIESTASTSYTLGVNDTGKAIEFTSNDPVSVTIPEDSTYEFNIGQTFLLIQKGNGVVSIDGEVGVTLNGYSVSSPVDTSGQYAVVTLLKLDSNEWIIFGNIA